MMPAAPSEPEKYSIDEMMSRLTGSASDDPAEGELVTRSDGSQAVRVRKRKRRSNQPHKEKSEKIRRSRMVQVSAALILIFLAALAVGGAVVYANSVLGAHTAKYADFLDICIALIGRAPKAGCHLVENRRATLQVHLPQLPSAPDDAFYPLLGYLVGLLAGSRIPVVCGLESARPNLDDLKAFGAAFATTSAAPMFHIVNVTPEAASARAAMAGLPPEVEHHITLEELRKAWRELDSAADHQVDLVALGNPHFSETECGALAKLLQGRQRHPDTAIVLTLGRAVSARAERNGDLEVLTAFGVNVITDTCWCMLEEPVVPPAARVIMTNSGKYAHYAPGLTGRQVHFGALSDCAETACTGQSTGLLPAWLEADPLKA